MKKLITIISIFLIISAIPSPAMAIKIRNLDQVKYEVTIEHVGGQKHTITVDPGGIYRTLSPAITIYLEGNRPVNARYQEEYSIYKGELLIQRREIRRF